MSMVSRHFSDKITTRCFFLFSMESNQHKNREKLLFQTHYAHICPMLCFESNVSLLYKIIHNDFKIQKC